MFVFIFKKKSRIQNTFGHAAGVLGVSSISCRFSMILHLKHLVTTGVHLGPKSVVVGFSTRLGRSLRMRQTSNRAKSSWDSRTHKTTGKTGCSRTGFPPSYWILIPNFSPIINPQGPKGYFGYFGYFWMMIPNFSIKIHQKGRGSSPNQPGAGAFMGSI